MLGVLEGFFIIFSVIGAGYLLARTRVIPTQESRLILNRVAFFAATPALMFRVVAESDPSALFSPVIGVSALAAVVTALICAVGSVWWFHTDRATTTIGAAAASYVNSNSIGLPVGMYVLGKADYVAPLLVLQMVVMTPIILALITDVHGGQGHGRQTRSMQVRSGQAHAEADKGGAGLSAAGKNAGRSGNTWATRRATIRGVLKAALQGICSPIVVGAGLGLLFCLQGWEIPELVYEPVALLGGASIPLILISFGASLYKAQPLTVPEQRGATLLSLGMKTVGMPVIAGLLGWAFGLEGEDLYAVVILASLPAAQNVYNYAATYQKGTIVARDTILLSTMLALPVMLLVAGLFGV